MNVVYPAAWDALKYPWRRLELIWQLQDILGLKKTVAVQSHDRRIDDAYHFLFDDTDLASNPEKEIGVSLLHSHEVACISELSRRLDELCMELGDAASQAFIDHPKWQCVEDAASVALDMLYKAGIPDQDSVAE